MSIQGEKNLWDQLWANLMDKFGKNFQMKLPFNSYYWEDPAPGYIDYRTYDTFNVRPTWSAVGTHDAAGTNTYEAYGNLIKFAPKLQASPAQQQQITDIESQINRANSQKAEHQAESISAYRVAKQQAESIGLTVDPTLWFAKNEWTSIIDGDIAVVNKLVNEKAAILNQYPLNKEALGNFTPPTTLAATATDAGGKAFLKCFVGTDQFWKAIYNAPSPQTIINMMSKGGQQLMLHLDSSRSSSHMENSWAGGSASFDIGFFSIYASGSWKKFDLTESGESVSLSVTFDKIDSFTVSKEGWYDGGYLASLKKKDEWAPGYTADKVFGKDGLLPLVITDFLATIGMKLEVKISQSSFNKHEEDFNAAGGIQIGPFKFGGEGGSTEQQWDKHAADSTFTITMTDEYPYIIGYLVARADGERL